MTLELDTRTRTPAHGDGLALDVGLRRPRYPRLHATLEGEVGTVLATSAIDYSLLEALVDRVASAVRAARSYGTDVRAIVVPYRPMRVREVMGLPVRLDPTMAPGTFRLEAGE